MKQKADKKSGQYDPCKHEWGTDASVRRAKKITPKEKGIKSFKQFTKESYNGPGMWMPKQKDGKNWIVKYTATQNGKVHTQERKFRVKADALKFIKSSTATFKSSPNVTSFKFDKPEPYKK